MAAAGLARTEFGCASEEGVADSRVTGGSLPILVDGPAVAAYIRKSGSTVSYTRVRNLDEALTFVRLFRDSRTA